MSTAALIPVQEYLSTVYRPDCDYIEGRLEERNLGESDHSAIQFILARIFNANRQSWGIVAYPELRVQTAEDHFRVPDVTVLLRSDPKTPIVRNAPLICIEVLSPEDRISRMHERFADYFRMGVPNVWLIDPANREAWIVQPDRSLQHTATVLFIPGTPIRILLADIFAELEEMQTQA